MDGRVLSEAAFAFAYRMVDGVTWEMQSILNRLWTRRIEGDGLSSVRSVVADILAENEDEYAGLIGEMWLTGQKKIPRGLQDDRERVLSFCAIWWRRRDSNSRPPRCERDALPTELLPHRENSA